MKTRLIVTLMLLAGGALRAQQPLVPRVQSEPPDGTRPTLTWTVTADGATSTPASVLGKGPTLQIQATDKPAIARSNVTVTGQFTVRASFRRQGSNLASFGIVLGSLNAHTEFLVRSDAKWAIVPHGGVPGWASVSAARPESGEDGLEVRVTAGQAEFVVNGSSVQTLTVSAGALDGAPGFYVSAGGSVTISGVTIERSASTAGGGR